ncbi:MAG: helix-turn-helix domain-containing protein [Candidatus Omnitrophica bacterium]|nr:helix-turn-helix domain-containing protein [Candidatus Omnitrophota bacterium]
MKEKDKNKKTFLTTTEAAEFIHVSLSTLKKYIYQKKIKTLKTPGGHHRIRKSDLYKLYDQQ